MVGASKTQCVFRIYCEISPSFFGNKQPTSHELSHCFWIGAAKPMAWLCSKPPIMAKLQKLSLSWAKLSSSNTTPNHWWAFWFSQPQLNPNSNANISALKDNFVLEAGQREKQIVGWKDLALGRPDCFGEVKYHWTFYENWHGSCMVQGFKPRWTNLYIKVIIYRLVMSLAHQQIVAFSRCMIVP